MSVNAEEMQPTIDVLHASVDSNIYQVAMVGVASVVGEASRGCDGSGVDVGSRGRVGLGVCVAGPELTAMTTGVVQFAFR